MPELPEVETIRRDLRRVALKKPIERVVVRKPKLVRGSLRGFSGGLKGQVIGDIARRGKLLIFSLQPSGRFMLLHLKMTGQLIYRHEHKTVAGGHGRPDSLELPNAYTHIEWHFADGARLYFNDLRQFGFVALVDENAKNRVLAAYGVEPLTAKFTPGRLQEILSGRRVALKQVLLDQSRIAGLGNIYVDEACFRAGLRPDRRADSLTAGETRRLWRAIRGVLQLSLKYRGTTFSDYRDGRGQRGNFMKMLKVYGRSGRVCRRCRKHVIERSKVGQRGTAYCPACQV